MSAYSDNIYGAQLKNVSGVANLVVHTALARLQSAQNSGLQQAGSTLNKSTSSPSSAGSILNTVA